MTHMNFEAKPQSMALTHKEQQAKKLYVNTEKTQTEIADLLDVNRKTVHLWIKKGAWEQTKISAQQAPAVILQKLHDHIYRVNRKIAARDEDDRCPTMEEINMLRKLVNMTKAFPEKSVGTYMEAFSDITMHIDRVDHNLAKELTPHLERYMLGVIMNKDINLDEYDSSGAYIGLTESDKNGEFSILPESVPATATTNTYEPKHNAQNAPFPPLNKLSEIGELSADENNTQEDFPPEDWGGLPGGIRELKPSLRLSPYLHNSIIWINHINDITNKERQMDYPIRYYPDIDPIRLQNKWIYESKMRDESNHQELH